MATLINRLLSAIIGIIRIGFAIEFYGFTSNTVFFSFHIVGILCLIWFGDAIGRYTGHIGHRIISTETPGWFICLMGWLLLAGVPIVVYVVR